MYFQQWFLFYWCSACVEVQQLWEISKSFHLIINNSWSHIILKGKERTRYLTENSFHLGKEKTQEICLSQIYSNWRKSYCTRITFGPFSKKHYKLYSFDRTLQTRNRAKFTQYGATCIATFSSEKKCSVLFSCAENIHSCHLHVRFQSLSQALPLLPTIEVDGSTLITKDIKNITGSGFQRQTDCGGVAVGGGAFGGGFNTSCWTENMEKYNRYSHYNGQGNMRYVHGGTMTGQDHYYSQKSAGVFDGMALSDQYLMEYYANVSKHKYNRKMLNKAVEIKYCSFRIDLNTLLI